MRERARARWRLAGPHARQRSGGGVLVGGQGRGLRRTGGTPPRRSPRGAWLATWRRERGRDADQPVVERVRAMRSLSLYLFLSLFVSLSLSLYLYLSLSFSLSLSIYLPISTSLSFSLYVCVCMYVCMMYV